MVFVVVRFVGAHESENQVFDRNVTVLGAPVEHCKESKKLQGGRRVRGGGGRCTCLKAPYSRHAQKFTRR